VTKVCPELVVMRDHQEQRGLQEPLVAADYREHQESPDLREQPDHPVVKDYRE
jgi:hypothetical protein